MIEGNSRNDLGWLSVPALPSENEYQLRGSKEHNAAIAMINPAIKVAFLTKRPIFPGGFPGICFSVDDIKLQEIRRPKANTKRSLPLGSNKSSIVELHITNAVDIVMPIINPVNQDAGHIPMPITNRFSLVDAILFQSPF